MAINENKLAQAVTAKEGGKQSVSLAQVKEVQGKVLDALAAEKPSDVLALLEKRRAKTDVADAGTQS